MTIPESTALSSLSVQEGVKRGALKNWEKLIKGIHKDGGGGVRYKVFSC